MGSTWGKNIRISLFGESHGAGIGVVIDGFPAGVRYDEEFILAYMRRRAPGGRFSTKRVEPDLPELLSGVKNGVTTGFPIAALIRNTSQRSADYGEARIPRPSHADYAAWMRYGESCDLAGGGHFSGRLTAPLVFAGALCSLELSRRGVECAAHLLRILDVTDESFLCREVTPELLRALRKADFPALDPASPDRFAAVIDGAQARGDSVGAVIECAVAGLPVGVGEHMFRGVEGVLSSALFGIPAVKGVQFGLGFDFAGSYGSQANDAITLRGGKVRTESNNCGGITGGMTNGEPLIFSVAMKPTPSIFLEQDSVELDKMECVRHKIKGRHDPCVAFRALPVVECTAALALLDLMLDPPARAD